MEVQVLGHHGQVGEEIASGDEFFAGFLPQPAHLVADGVDGEGDEVEHQQHVGQAFVAVSKVVFEVVSVVLEFVEGFVFDFPSASCTLDQLLDVASRDRDGDDEVAFVGFASVAMDLQCHPVDAHRIVAVPNWHVVEPLVDSGFLVSPCISHLGLQLFQLDALMVFVQGGKPGFLGGGDGVGTLLLDDGLANRLAGVQDIAEMDRSEVLVSGRIVIQPSFQRAEFAVLPGCIVLGSMNCDPTAPRGCGRGPPARPKVLREDTESRQCCCWFECCTARNAPWSSDETQCRPTRSGIARPAGETTSILQAFAAAPSVLHQATVERLRRNSVQALANVVVERNPSDPEQRC